MQREHRRLDAQPDNDEGKPGLHHGRLVERRKPRRHVGHVERAGRRIEKANTDHIEGRADRPHDEVIEGRRQRPPVALLAYRHQRIRADGRDLEEHERVEGVAREYEPHQPRLTQQETSLEQRVLLRAHLRHKAVPGEHRRQRTDAADQQPHQRAHRIDTQRDPHRRIEPAQHIDQHALAHDLAGHRQRHPRSEDRGCNRNHPRCARARRQRRSARAQQWNDNREDWRLRRQRRRGNIKRFEQDHGAGSACSAATRLSASISSASTVPYASRTRTAIASPTASVATPTTMAVRMRTCGNGLE